MSRHRFFLAGPFLAPRVGAVLDAPLSAGDLRHATRALRLRVAEEIDLIEPSGPAWRVGVAAVADDALSVELLEALPRVAEPDVTLVFGVLKGSKNDDVIEGAVEVGVTGVLPVIFERSIVRLDAQKRAERGERWRRVAGAAAKQAKRSRVPVVVDPVAAAELPGLLRGYDAVLIAWEDAEEAGIGTRLSELHLADVPAAARVAVVVGPEGGLSAEEVAALEAGGAHVCTLGSTILRAETAGVVAAALVVYELGGLGNRR